MQNAIQEAVEIMDMIHDASFDIITPLSATENYVAMRKLCESVLVETEGHDECVYCLMLRQMAESALAIEPVVRPVYAGGEFYLWGQMELATEAVNAYRNTVKLIANLYRGEPLAAENEDGETCHITGRYRKLRP